MPDREKTHMNLNTNPDPEFERLLRSALATYAEPESESNLVHGILARVAAESRPAPARRWLPWAIAIPVLACLLALVVLFDSKPAHTPAHDQNQVQSAQPALEPPVRVHPSAGLNWPESRRSKSPVERMRPQTILIIAKSVPVPKQDVFPTPQPLTPAERALVAFGVGAPESERQSLIGSQEQLQEPIKISAIEIQPLDSPDQGGN
jgi:hypothetical protein